MKISTDNYQIYSLRFAGCQTNRGVLVTT
jgi:hypothetical protein